MKQTRMARSQRVARHGVSRWDMLVILVSVGVLAFLFFTPIGHRTPAERNRTIAVHGAIRSALERYKETFGDYPAPVNPGEPGPFSGASLRTGAAHMLYQAITADGNSAIVLWDPSPDGLRESDGKLDDSEAKSSLGSCTLPKGCVHPTDLPVGAIHARLIVDGWGRPFQYIKADPDPAKNKAINSTYDLWSYGPQLDSNSHDDSPDSRRDEKRTASWITNWR